MHLTAVQIACYTVVFLIVCYGVISRKTITPVKLVGLIVLAMVFILAAISDGIDIPLPAGDAQAQSVSPSGTVAETTVGDQSGGEEVPANVTIRFEDGISGPTGTLIGPPGIYVVQSSTDEGKWADVATVTNVVGSVSFVDPHLTDKTATVSYRVGKKSWKFSQSQQPEK